MNADFFHFEVGSMEENQITFDTIPNVEGAFFKSVKNFKDKSSVCYVPPGSIVTVKATGEKINLDEIESSLTFNYDDIEIDDVYSYQEFIKATGGNEEAAFSIIEVIADSYYTIEGYIEGFADELEICEKCGYLYYLDQHQKCPKCC